MHLAQFDIVKPKYPKNDIRMDPFYSSTKYVNDLAERQPGFIWREKHEDSELLEDLWGPGYLYTLSVWRDVESLTSFLYQSPHIEFLKRKNEWFELVSKPKVVMWWICEGTVPTLGEAHERMVMLYEHGPSLQAFDLKSSNTPVALY